MNFSTKLLHINDNLTEIISRLSKVKRTGNGKYIACCPAHNDNNPSLVLTQKPDGVVLMFCHSCGARGVAICEALNIDPSTLFPPSDNPRYQKAARSGFSAWQLLHALRTDLIRLLIIANDLKKIGALSDDDRQFIAEVVLRLNDGISYMEGSR